jgi:hypothetical protein
MAGEQLAGEKSYQQGEPCPKCGYARTPADSNPSWQCPNCLVAYAKVRPRAASAAARLVADRHELAIEARADRSVYSLLAANALAGAVALYFNMPARDLAIVYWLQSVFIGLSFFVRILSLRGYTVNRNPDDFERIPGKPGANIPVALTFISIFALAHLFYLAFLLNGPKLGGGAAGIMIGACALVFGLNHLFSLLHNLPLDSKATPNLDAMLFIPFLRVMPMHIVASSAAAMMGERSERTLALVILILAKTGADVLMHVIEHHELRRHPLDSLRPPT